MMTFTRPDGMTITVPDVNGLPLPMVRQWAEYPTSRTFAVSVPTELRRAYYSNDASFSDAMRKAGYVPVRTRKLTGKLSSFWLYRVTGNDKGVCTAEPAPHRASRAFVQVSHRPIRAFKRLAVDGQWLYVYADHVRLLTKKRIRVDGRQVTGYTAKGLRVEVMA